MGSPNTGFNTSLGQSGTVKVNGTKPPPPSLNKTSLPGLPEVISDQFSGNKAIKGDTKDSFGKLSDETAQPYTKIISALPEPSAEKIPPPTNPKVTKPNRLIYPDLLFPLDLHLSSLENEIKFIREEAIQANDPTYLAKVDEKVMNLLDLLKQKDIEYLIEKFNLLQKLEPLKSDKDSHDSSVHDRIVDIVLKRYGDLILDEVKSIEVKSIEDAHFERQRQYKLLESGTGKKIIASLISNDIKDHIAYFNYLNGASPVISQVEETQENSLEEILLEWGISEETASELAEKIKDNPKYNEDLIKKISLRIEIINSLPNHLKHEILGFPLNERIDKNILAFIIAGNFLESSNYSFLLSNIENKLEEWVNIHKREASTYSSELETYKEKNKEINTKLENSLKSGVSTASSWLPFLTDGTLERVGNPFGTKYKDYTEEQNELSSHKGRIDRVIRALKNSTSQEKSNLFYLEIAQVTKNYIEKVNLGKTEEAAEIALNAFKKYGNNLRFLSPMLWADLTKTSETQDDRGILQKLRDSGLLTENVINRVSNNNGVDYKQAANILINNVTPLDKEISSVVAFQTIDNDPDFVKLQIGAVELKNALPELQSLLKAALEGGNGARENFVAYMRGKAGYLNKILEDIDEKKIEGKIKFLESRVDNIFDINLRNDLVKRLNGLREIQELFKKPEVVETTQFIRDKSKFNTQDWAGWWDSGEGKEFAIKLGVAVTAFTITVASLGTLLPFSIVLIAGALASSTAGVLLTDVIMEIEHSGRQWDKDIQEGDTTYTRRGLIGKWAEEHITDPQKRETFIELLSSFAEEVAVPMGSTIALDFVMQLATMGISEGMASAVNTTLSKIIASTASNPATQAAREALLRKIVDRLAVIGNLSGGDEAAELALFKELFKELADETFDEIKEEVALAIIGRTDATTRFIVAALVGAQKGINIDTNSSTSLKQSLEAEGYKVTDLGNRKFEVFDESAKMAYVIELAQENGKTKIKDFKITNNNEVINADLVIDREELLSELPQDVQDKLKNDYAFLNIPGNVKILISSNIPYAGVVNYGVDGKAESLTISEETLNNLKSPNPKLRLHGLDVLLHETTHTYQTGISPQGLTKGDYVTRRAIQEIAAINAGRAKAYGTQAKNVEGAKAFRDKLKTGDIQGAIDTAIEHGLIGQDYIVRYNAEYDRYLDTTRVAASNQAEIGETQLINTNNDLLTTTPKPNEPGLTGFLNQPQEVQDLAPKAERNATLTSVLDTEGGSTATVFNGTIEGSNEEVAIKVYLDPIIQPGIQIDNESEYTANKWKQSIGDFNSEIEGLKLMDSLGLGPKFHGVVDVDGNPALAMEKINGSHPEQLTPEQARELITEETIANVNKQLTELAKKGYYTNDLQFLIVTQDGNGRKKGDIVFIDLVGIEPIAKTNMSQDEAADAMIEPTEAMLRGIIQDSTDKTQSTSTS